MRTPYYIDLPDWRPGYVHPLTGDEILQCPACDQLFTDGTGARLGSAYLCERCYFTHPVIVGELAAQLAADERRDQFEKRDR